MLLGCLLFSQDRLNHVMVLYVHKGEAKEISLDEATEEFIFRNERRTLFGVKNTMYLDVWIF